MLDEMEITKLESFEFDFNFSVNPVQTSQRLSWANATYHSQNYNRVCNRRCNYAIKYQGISNLFDFGLIKYFVKINNLVLVAVSSFKIFGNSLTKIGGRTSMALTRLKNSSVFNQIFAEVIETNDHLFIETSRLVSKCILGKNTNSNIYLLSEFIIEDEHE